jgi:hypothetical protein
MLSLTFNGTDQAFTQSVRAKYPAVLASLVTNLNAVDFLLQGHIQQFHLSGPTGPTSLSARTGAGRNSVRVIPAKIEAEAIVGGVQAGGGAQWYMRLQNEGVPHAWTILPKNKKALSFMMNGNRVVVKSVVHPPLPARHFMETSQAEMQETIVARLQKAVTEGLK